AELTKCTAAMVLVGCSSWWCSTPAVRWRRRRCLARTYSKHLLEENAGGGGRSGESAGHSSRASPPHFSLRICLRLDIRRCVRACHLRSSFLRIAGVFFVLASEIPALVVIGNILDHLERISLVRW